MGGNKKALNWGIGRSVFRFLTPGEVNELSILTDGKNTSLTEVLLGYMGHAIDEKDDVIETEELIQRVSIGKKVAEILKKSFSLYKKKSKSELEKMETNMFIIEQKFIFENTLKKLKKIKNIKVYSPKKKAVKSTNQTDSKTGIIVNKKQH